MAKINVNIGSLELKNPVMTASGTFGYGIEYQDLVPLNEIGGIIVKGTTLKPREGNCYPRIVLAFRIKVLTISARKYTHRLRILIVR